uniref:Protein phosphatase 1 regulatory subunit 14 n=2 Tax=Equus asinus TaxID=9793 RepID=A0A8C4LRZ2_EQUAS
RGVGRAGKTARNLRRSPSSSPSWRLAVPCPRRRRAGATGGSGFRALRDPGRKRDSLSPGGEDTVPGSEDHLWHQTHASPLWPLHTGDRSCLRAHTFLPLRATPTPGPLCLPGARSASPAGARGSSAASLRLRSPPLPPPRPPRPALLGVAAAPPDLPTSRAARGAGAGEPLECRCPARGGSGAGRAPLAPPPGRIGLRERGDMSVATGSNEAAGGASGGGARVFFQSPRGGAGGSPGSSSGSGSSREDSAPVATAAADGQVQPPPQQQQQRRHQQGKVTVKYDRKELRKRLVLEEWIVEQLGQLYGCEEEEMPEVEIDIDDLLDADSEEDRASKLREALIDCYKPTEEFIKELLSRIRGMRKLNPPQKKTI